MLLIHYRRNDFKCFKKKLCALNMVSTKASFFFANGLALAYNNTSMAKFRVG